MNSNVVYGDPKNISVFDIEKPFETKSGLKVACTEPYAKELVEVYEDYFNGKIIQKYSLDAGDIVKGYVSSINKDELVVDIGQREFAYVSISKDKILAEDFSISQEVEIMIMESQERSQYLKASISEKIKKELYDDMLNADSNNVYDAKVLQLSNNGYDLDICGLKVFMPGSLGGINRLTNFNSLVGKTIKVMTVKNNNSYSRYKNSLIVSHREYLKTLIPDKLNALELGKQYTGRVTDTTKFGIFVEFEDVLTGLIHKDEFDEILSKLFEKGEVHAGVEIEFYLKEIINPKRIILSRNAVDLSEVTTPEYKKYDKVNGKISKVTKYGAFVKFGKNVSGLVHISKMKDIDVSRGDKVKCKIININNNKYDLAFI